MATGKRAIATLMSAILFLFCFGGCSGNKAVNFKMPETVSENDAGWSQRESGLITLKNDCVEFVLDCATTHFTVKDLRNGKSYSSVPAEETFSFSDESAERLRSEITVTYYQQQSAAQLMFSAKDCVDSDHFKILTENDAIRVYYHLGENPDEFFAPRVFPKKDFEKLVLDMLENPNERRRISGYYTLYDKNKATEDFSEMLQEYPALKTNPLYILDPLASQNNLEEITACMEKVGYTREQYREVVEKLGITTKENQKAGFCIPVEYRLCDDGFTASILSDLITENSTEYKLQRIDFLEFFAARDEKSSGNYLIPDGSGALIRINGSYKTDFARNFYGTDFSLLEEGESQISQNLMLPVYGICESDGGILAVIESAAEVADLHVKTISNSAPLNQIYAGFVMRAVDVTDISENTNVPVYNLFSNHLLRISPKIKFVLFDAGKAEYSDMAEYYRRYLYQNGSIDRINTEGTPLYLDYLCMILEPSSVLGISYHKKIVLSTISEIMKTVQRLNESGVENIMIRLKGYGSAGLTNKAHNRFELDPKVGTVKELTALSKLLSKNGGALYLDADFQFVYHSGNGFSKKDSASHYLNRTVIYNGLYDIVARKQNTDSLPRYFTSPSVYSSYSIGFLHDAAKKLPKDTAWRVSFGTSGQYLASDYATKKDIDRAEGLFLLNEALRKTEKKAMFDYGNAYVLPFADSLFNVPLTSSAVDMESMRIPFYQMLIHGGLPYCGISVNLSQDPTLHYLQSVEYGAALSATCITGENALLINTDYESVYYSLNDGEQLERLVSLYQRAKTCMEKTRGAEMIGNEKLSENFYCTSYENGIKVLVNYGKTEKTAYGQTVNAMDFAVFEE